jgi:hypothetical protein
MMAHHDGADPFGGVFLHDRLWGMLSGATRELYHLLWRMEKYDEHVEEETKAPDESDGKLELGDVDVAKKLMELPIGALNAECEFSTSGDLAACVIRLKHALERRFGSGMFRIYDRSDFGGRVRGILHERVICAFDDGALFHCTACRCAGHFVGFDDTIRVGMLGLVQNHEPSVKRLEDDAGVLAVPRWLTKVSLPEVRTSG